MKLGTRGVTARPGKFVCKACKASQHELCIDLARSVYTHDKICECSKHDSKVA